MCRSSAAATSVLTFSSCSARATARSDAVVNAATGADAAAYTAKRSPLRAAVLEFEDRLSGAGMAWHDEGRASLQKLWLQHVTRAALPAGP